jgi:hypothetical protein
MQGAFTGKIKKSGEKLKTTINIARSAPQGHPYLDDRIYRTEK